MLNKSKVMRNMLIGMIGAAICMLACWLAMAYGKGNVRNGYIQSNWPKMSYLRFEASLILSGIGISLYYVGLKEMIKVIKTMRSRRRPISISMARLFEVGAVTTVISYMFIQAGYIMMALVYKMLFNTSLMGTDIISTVEGMFYYIAIPLLSFLVLSVAGVSIPCIYFMYCDRFKVLKVCMLFNPFILWGLGELLKLTKNYHIIDFASAAIPFGYLLMMAAGLSHVAKMPSKKKGE